MECTICFENYSKDRPPYMLNCGHPFCLGCLKVMVSGRNIQCPLCKEKQFVDSVETVENHVVVNLSILNKYRNRNEEQKDPSRYSISKDPSHGLNIEIPNGFKCRKHKLPVHSYVKSNSALMCNECIESSSYDAENIEPIPQILKQLNSSLHSSKVKKEQCMSQLKMCQKELEIFFEKNRDATRHKIHDYFSSIVSMVKEIELKALAEFELKTDKELEKLHQVFNEIKSVNKNIQSDIINIDNLFAMDDKTKVVCMDLLEKIEKEKNEYYKDIDFPNYFLDIQTKPDNISLIKDVVEKSFDFSSEIIPNRDKRKLFMNMFDLRYMWYCHRCKHKNLIKKAPIECSRCHIYKPLELYPSVFKSKSEITDGELEHLKQRGTEEKLRMSANNQSLFDREEGRAWYAVEAKWMYDWKMFVQNKRDSCVPSFKKSDIDRIGILDPGPISNNILFNSSGDLKEDLVIEKDYKMVNERVWKTLFDIYGGGPIIKRAQCNIYSEKSLQIRSKSPEKLIRENLKRK
ncbi:unnamed protein product [Moneuplotes crassus]|uniref:Uncharacterized protein n=1 Tax=Euplotes crassus TaxID=5936 RepID=A0AAD1U8N1_EUPCR|nr:unnamed protein product [Moneuplotes crassus]